jgi:hypothetical protein
MTMLVSVAATAIFGCNYTTKQKAETLEKAKVNVEAASMDLDIARNDSAEYANFRIESGKKLRENELLIADMKDKMNLERQESNARYERQLDSLDLENSRLRSNMHLYTVDGKAKWEAFKTKFNLELENLGKAITRFAEKNKKKDS